MGITYLLERKTWFMQCCSCSQGHMQHEALPKEDKQPIPMVDSCGPSVCPNIIFTQHTMISFQKHCTQNTWENKQAKPNLTHIVSLTTENPRKMEVILEMFQIRNNEFHQFSIFNSRCKNLAYDFPRLSSSYYYKSCCTTTPEDFNPLSWKLVWECFQSSTTDGLLRPCLQGTFGHADYHGIWRTC